MSPDRKRFFDNPWERIRQAFTPEKKATPEDIAQFWTSLRDIMQDPRLQAYGPLLGGIPGVRFLYQGAGNDSYSTMRLFTEVELHGQTVVRPIQIVTSFSCDSEGLEIVGRYSIPGHNHKTLPLIPDRTPIYVGIYERHESMQTDGTVEGSLTRNSDGTKPITEKDLQQFKQYVEKAQFVDFNEEYIPGGLRYRHWGV